MPESEHTINAQASLDVQDIERQLNELWMQNAEAGGRDEDGAVMRARVLNLMVYVTDERTLPDVDEMLMDVAAMHPCRALVMLASTAGGDHDIQVHVSSRCRLESGAGGRHLCCEQVTLRASGRFTVEIPSAAIPLLIADLPVFLWWHAPVLFDDEIFRILGAATDRVIVDTATFGRPRTELSALAEFLQRRRRSRPAVSDLNWARLTPWRALLASFYDVPGHLSTLERLSRVRINYVASAVGVVTPKALILAGWLASRLDWRVIGMGGGPPASEDVHEIVADKDGQQVTIEFRRVDHDAVVPGGIARIELIVESQPQTAFVVMRAEDCRDLEIRDGLEGEGGATRVLLAGDLSEAHLLASELEILSHDRVYEEAVAKAVEMAEAIG